MNKDYNRIIYEVKNELTDIPEDVIRKVYSSVWNFIKKDIAEQNVSANPKSNSYSIYKLGKLYANEQTCKKYKYEYNKNLTAE